MSFSWQLDVLRYTSDTSAVTGSDRKSVNQTCFGFQRIYSPIQLYKSHGAAAMIPI